MQSIIQRKVQGKNRVSFKRDKIILGTEKRFFEIICALRENALFAHLPSAMS
jgi:hypothetical protein